MSVEFEFRKLLEANGFKDKKPGRFEWSYACPGHRVIVYTKGYVWFNELAELMRKQVRKDQGKVTDLTNIQWEEFYRKILSRLEFYNDIKPSLFFPFQKNSTHKLGISQNVGIEILNTVLQSILTGKAKTDLSDISRTKSHTLGTYLPTKTDVKMVIKQIPGDNNNDIAIDLILNQVEKNMIANGKSLKHNWQLITERNFEIWFNG